MAESTSIPAESILFEAAWLFVQFRYQAEQSWCDPDPSCQTDLRHIAKIKAQLMVSIRSIAAAASATASNRVEAFAAAIEEFWTYFRMKWQGAERSLKIKELTASRREQEYQVYIYLFQGCPFQDGQWKKVQTEATNALAALDPPLRGCFELSAMLASELCPTLTDGQMSRDPELALAQLHVEFTAQVTLKMQVLREDFPFLSGLRFDLNSHDAMDMLREINDFRKKVGALLRDPGSAPGYLGLVLDGQRRTVTRHGKTVKITGETRWKILKMFERSGIRICPHSDITYALDPLGTSLAARDKAISDLRLMLKPLEIYVKTERGMGATLMDISDLPEKRKRKSAKLFRKNRRNPKRRKDRP